jgi:hypothetical protein
MADLSRDDADALLDVDRWAFPDPHAGEDPEAIAAALD